MGKQSPARKPLSWGRAHRCPSSPHNLAGSKDPQYRCHSASPCPAHPPPQPRGAPYMHPGSCTGGDDSHVHPRTTQAQPPASRVPPATCTTAAVPPRTRHLRAPPPATALPGCTCANTPAPHSRRLHTGPFPRLRLMHTWSRLHPCAPTGACPPCGMLLTTKGWWGMGDICACQASHSPELSPGVQPLLLQLLQTTLTPQHLLEAAAPSTCTHALPADPHTA